jgi:nitronate monooxygenase
VDHTIEIERAKGAALKIEDIKEPVGGRYGRIMIDGGPCESANDCTLGVGPDFAGAQSGLL